MTHRTSRLVAALALVFACDSGYEVGAQITVPNDIAAAYGEANPGLLLARFRADEYNDVVLPVAMICGQGGTFRSSGSGDGTVEETTVVAWIEPMSGRACDDPIEKRVLEEGFVADAGEPQASAVAPEETGCGAHEAEVALTLARP